MFVWKGARATVTDRTAILQLHQSVGVINDEARWGCRRMASSTACWHWLIEWGEKNQCRERPWHGRDDKNTITTATASKLFTTYYAQRLLFLNHRLLYFPRARRERVYWKTIYVDVINEGVFFFFCSLWLMIIHNNHNMHPVFSQADKTRQHATAL